MKLDIILHNWRCFSNAHISIPLKPFAIIDENGKGKTSILSAVYTLLTGVTWPRTKSLHNMKASQNYLGIIGSISGLSYAGRVNPSGRLVTKSEKIGLSDWKNMGYDVAPCILTYTPDENDWLKLARSEKIHILDSLMSVACGSQYTKHRKSLDNFLKHKNLMIRAYRQENKSFDEILLKTYNQGILDHSLHIWTMRHSFLTYLQSQLPEFSSWINSPLHKWSVNYTTSDNFGFRQSYDLNKYIETTSVSLIKTVFERELQAGSSLFGAHRDNLIISCEGRDVEDILSRGEMRLLILFIKKITYSFMCINSENSPKLWWFLDDVCSDMDQIRETILYEKIIKDCEMYIITGTKKPSFEIAVFTIGELLLDR